MDLLDILYAVKRRQRNSLYHQRSSKLIGKRKYISFGSFLGKLLNSSLAQGLHGDIIKNE